MTTRQQEGPVAGSGQALEDLIRRRLRAGARPRPAIGRADRDRPLRLSAGQQQMWFLHRFDPASPAYLMTWALRLSGPFDAEAMRRAWERIVERHEILRTRYDQPGDEPVQIVDPPARFELRTVSVADLPAAGREERAGQIAAWERDRPFDLAVEHPLRVTLIAVGEDLHFLVVHMHHIACDGSSYLRLATELNTLYAAFSRGGPADLPQPQVQYADYAAWELAGRHNGSLRPHLDYWSRTLKDVGELPLPLDRPRPARPDWHGGTADVVITPGTAEAVRALASEHRASPYMVLLAAYQAVLADISGCDDVAVGLPVSGRTVPELDDLVGYTMNTMVVRSRYQGHDTFAQLIDRVRERFLDAFDHRAVPFKWVVDEVNPARGAGGNPLFQAAFDMDPTEEGAFRFPDLQVDHLRLEMLPSAKFDLTLHIEEAADRQLFGRLEFAASVIDEATARRWAAHCERLLDAAVREPHEPLAALHERSREPVAQAVEQAVVEPVLEPGAGAARADREARERMLTVIHRTWCEVLGVDDVDVQDNFFDVGGDSLRAVALAGRLKAEGIEVSAADVFAYQTIEDLAGACADRAGRTPDSGASARTTAVAPFALISEQDRAALPPRVTDAYPLAAMQLGMLVELRSRPDLNTYQDTTSYLIRGDGDFDPAALQAAVQRVVDRHEVLRTGFDLNSYSVPLQLVREEAAITVGVTDHGALGDEGYAPRLRVFAARERSLLIDPAHPPLIRVHAHTARDSADWCITITECHPILEGWSFHTMLMEILTGYRELRVGRSPEDPDPVPFRYADYVAAELEAVRSPEHRAYWRGVVEGRSDAVLPTAWQDAPDTPRDRYQCMVDYRDLEADLRRLAAQTRTSMKAVLLAAHMKVMSMAVGCEEFFTGLVCDARPEVAGAERVLGMYLNTLPFAMPAGARTWGELVTAVYEELTGLWPHRVLPVQVVQQEVGRGGRLLEVFFNYLDFHQVDQALLDGDQTYNDNENEFALHVFTIVGLVKLNTTNHCLSRAAADRLCALYRTVLEEMSRGPQGDAGAPCLPAVEARRLRALGTGPDVTREPETVPQAFARLARDRPDAFAVRCGGGSLTYARLDAWAQRIAHRLRRCGVGAGALVALVPGRDAGTLAALLAVWKVGAAWIPVDPADQARVRGLRGSGRDAKVSAVVAAAPVDDADGQWGVPVVLAGDEAAALPGTAAQTAAVVRPAGRNAPVRPQDPACLLPAGPGADPGVAVFSHRALAQALDSAVAGLAVPDGAETGPTAWLCAAELPFPGALTELLAPITTGGCAVITAAPFPDAVAEARDLVAAGAVSHLAMTALAAEHVLADGRVADGVTAILGGADSGTGTGGPGSTGTGRLIPADGADALPGWVTFHGRPLPGVTVRVLDPRLRPLPVGVVGELCVGGAALPDALRGDPARTAERLVPDPVGDPGSRLLRTGLLARFAADGTVEQVGPQAGQDQEQTDGAGPRDELYRTRELLDAHPSVRDSSVLLRPGLPQDKDRLVGYVRIAPGAPFDPNEVRRSLVERRLPRHLVPDVLVPVDAWPLTARGRIDQDLLPEPVEAEDEPCAQDKPWDDTFERLIQEAVSSDEPVQPDMPLSEAGLDSLATVGLLVALEKAYGVTLPDELLVVDMFRTPRTLWKEVADLL
jgi:non-ribosomal peptide synthetase component F/acyl carrier protein